MTNIDERIKQCEVNIKALEQQKQQLLEEKEKKEKLEPGDICIYPGDENKRLIVSISGKIYAVNARGYRMAEKAHLELLDYKKIGRCAGFNVA